MSATDLAWLMLELGIMAAVSWVAYRAGRHAGETQAMHTISALRGHLRSCTQRLERTSYELNSLREALRLANVRSLGKPEPEWMRDKL